jgi:hypothetical protein
MSYRDYIEDPDERQRLPATPSQPLPPRPGHGVVWVNGRRGEFSWSASWQEGPRIANSPDGSREQAMAWAREFPAPKRVVFSAELQDYVEFD